MSSTPTVRSVIYLLTANLTPYSSRSSLLTRLLVNLGWSSSAGPVISSLTNYLALVNIRISYTIQGLLRNRITDSAEDLTKILPRYWPRC